MQLGRHCVSYLLFLIYLGLSGTAVGIWEMLSNFVSVFKKVTNIIQETCSGVMHGVSEEK